MNYWHRVLLAKLHSFNPGGRLIIEVGSCWLCCFPSPQSAVEELYA